MGGDGKLSKKRKTVSFAVFISLVVLLLIGIILTGGSGEKEESIQEAMKDAVLHEHNVVSLFGIRDVNPSLIAAYLVTAAILIFAIIIRIFAVPRFKETPGKFQMLIEEWVNLFTGLARNGRPEKYNFIAGYIFTAGSYIFIGTLFELLGVQVNGTKGQIITLPAPLCDINAAIAMGVSSYLIIMFGGISANGFKGILKTLKEFSLPISMSFRLFGALLSGMLVTELVYYYIRLSFVLPVIVGVLFTLMHALIQAYVLTMLTSTYYGEVSEKSPPKVKKEKHKKNDNTEEATEAA